MRSYTFRLRGIALFVAALALLSAVALASSPAKYEEGKVYRHQLENGLTVLTMERHIAPLVYHQVTYKVGSRNERLGITGISHVVEHMMFKGTEKYGKGEVSKLISKNSGIFNAFTMNDMTSYFEYLPTNKVELALDIESDRMMNSMFDPSEFKSEIEVILQERRMRTESDSRGVFQETMSSVAYQSHPNRDPIIGWPGDLRHITREDAFKYYKTYYTPNNAFLVLVGDFETDKILETVKKYYAKIPRGPEVPETWVSEQPQKVRKSFTLKHSDITQPSFRMAFHIPTYADSDAASLRIAGMILCERSRDARLYKRLVEKDRIATMAAGGMGMAKDPTLFSISVVVAPDSSVERAEAIVWEEISRMQNELVSDKELQKVKNRYRFGQVTEYTKNADIGGRIARYEAYFGLPLLKEFGERIMNVTKEDVQRVLRQYFGPELVTIGFSYPKDGKGKPRKAVEVEDEQGEDKDEHFYLMPDVFFFRPPMNDSEIELAAMGSSASEDIIRPKPITPLIKSTKLENGINLYTVENHLVPAVFIGGLIETGNMLEANDGQKPGISAFLADVMNRSTEAMKYEQLSERMAFVPFSFSVSGSYRSFSFQGYSLLPDADEMMKVGYEMVTRPGLDEDQMDKIRPRHMISARDRLKKTSVAAFYYMFNKIFDDHPYSKNNSTEASIKSITKDDLKKLHTKYFRPERVTLVMMGDMTPEEMKALANKYFGTWKSSGQPAAMVKIPPVHELKTKEIKVFTEKDYTECTVNVGFAPVSDVNPDDQEAVDVLNYILASSALTSRMGIQLRDKQGLIYGIKSELWAPTGSIGYWKFNTKTAPKNAEKVVTGIFGEIRKLLEGGITDEELQTAKQRRLGLLPFFIETPDDIATRVFEMLRDKEPLDSFDKKAERILAVKAEDVMRIAKKYFTLDRFIVVVDGPIEQHSLDHLLDTL